MGLKGLAEVSQGLGISQHLFYEWKTSETASVVFTPSSAFSLLFLIAYIVYLLVLGIIFSSTRFAQNSILPPVGATGD